ncbi:MAG TPA: ferrous iron transport protein B [Pyrinomonadaceae bacterium]|nr:ferrous iron transport protein B [Pyrinomonadaceae bacterium]
MTKNKQGLTIALAGNPNAGKTTLFNSLTGLKQKVANYPGVTVERKEGVWHLADNDATLIDLPGLYSLDATSLDEQIARDIITGEQAGVPKPDVIVAVVDATNLERNLYLVTQMFEFGVPVVVSLTMIDVFEKQGHEIDIEMLAAQLKSPVVAVNAKSGRGAQELAEKVASAVGTTPDIPYEYHQEDLNSGPHGKIFARYNFIANVVQESVWHSDHQSHRITDKIDRVLTHKFFGLVILVAILLLVFQTIFSWASLPMDLLEKGFGAVGDFVKAEMPPGILTDLLVDGVIAGVGGVVVFLPQILLLFLFISLLEDSGYMARAAFLLDKLMSRVGLHGKAFLPLISSFACAIPGIMATRTIESRRDRFATIMIAPFMSCSARLPVYTLMIGAFFGGKYVFGFISLGAVLMLSMYALGVFVAIIVAFILKRTVLKAATPPLLMEMPPYRMPNLRTVFQNMITRAGLFLKRAGTVILTLSIVLWAMMNFPRPSQNDIDQITTEVEQTCNCTPKEAQDKIDTMVKARMLDNSIAGTVGHAMEPVIAPLGYDWRIGIGLMSAFAAREVFVSTMSILYNVGRDGDAENESLLQAVRDAKDDDGKPIWTPLLAFTTMMFFLLAMQCMSTLAVVRRETNSWRWPIFMTVYMCGLAYIVCFLAYQGGKALGYG